MIDMCRKFHTNNLACLEGCYDQSCQMLRTGQAVLINTASTVIPEAPEDDTPKCRSHLKKPGFQP